MNPQPINTYLVGGAVRDKLLGRDSQDRDYVVVGTTPEHMLAQGFKAVGADFPVFLHPQSKEEYALARTERKTGKGYTGFAVVADQTVTLEDDLARRDLTINAMAMDEHGDLIDPFNGKADLERKLLRHTTEAFVEDPVRVLRICRFLARFGSDWTIHPSTLELMKQLQECGELDNLVPERIFKETEKALTEPNPHLYFMTLNGMGIFPEIEQMVGVPQPVEHHPEGDVYTHTMLCLQRAADLKLSLETRFAVLTHDFGKAESFRKTGNLLGHENRGVAVIKGFCERLKVSNKLRVLAELTSDNHTLCHKIFELTPKKVHKLIVEKLNALVHPERFEQFLEACECDAQGRGPTKVNIAYPQKEFARGIALALTKLDKKAVVQMALSQGKTHEKIGEAVREAEIATIRAYIKEHKRA